ncbi:MAG: YIP1 family protein [Candidatus Tyrphobacter sp.]
MDSTKSASGSALQTIIDTVLAPHAAFERIRTAPTWILAIIVSTVVGAICSYLTIPAFVHGLQASWPALVAANPRMAQGTPEQQQVALSFALGFAHWAWIAVFVGVPIAILITSVIMLLFNALGRGSATFAMLWAAATNVTVPTTAISGIVLAIVALVRGAQSFDSAQAVYAAIPSIAWIVPSSNVKLAAFLGALNIFQIWGAVLLYVAMRVTARVGQLPAILLALVILIGSALIATTGAR